MPAPHRFIDRMQELRLNRSMKSKDPDDPSDYEGKRHALQLEQVFFTLLLQAEIAVHRELLATLRANPPRPSITEKQIHQMVADRINKILATAADYGQNELRIFSALFEEWKKSNKI